MPVPATSRTTTSVFAIFASGVLIASLIGLGLTVRDWSSGTPIGSILAGVAVVLLGIGLVLEIPDFAEPRPTVSRAQRLTRLALAVASVLLLLSAIWIPGLRS